MVEEIKLTQQTTKAAVAYFEAAAKPPTKWRVCWLSPHRSRLVDRGFGDTKREAIGKAKLTPPNVVCPSPTVCDVEQLGVVQIQR